MYSKELEEVIDAALADGVITETERKVLHKKAAAEGVDPEELDVVIDGRLAKKKKEEDWLKPAPPKNLENEKHGNVVKCPSCGAQVDRTHAICPECGYAFTNVKISSVIRDLYEKLEIADGGSAKGVFGAIFDSEVERGKRKVQQKASIIENAPIPTAKEDILEFLSAAVPSATLVNPLTGTKNGRAKITAIGTIILMVLTSIIILMCGGGVVALGIGIGCCVGVGVYIAMFYVNMGGNASDNEHNQLASAWKSKCEQIVIKAHYGLRGDKKTLEEIDHYAQLIGIKNNIIRNS